MLCATHGCAGDVPRYGQARVLVDTDLPVESFRTRLRIDVYDDEGWFDTRDISLREPRDWPASFTVFDPRGRATVDLRVRLRAYPEGRVRDYRGERFEEEAPTGTPRCLRDGLDVTPSSEPAPQLAIDRLVRVRIVDSEAAVVGVVLGGACIGTMADVRRNESCVDREGTRVPIDGSPHASVAPGASERVGRFARSLPCPENAELRDDEVCVPGGPLIFGGSDATPGDPRRDAVSGLPERLAVVTPFRVDRHEVTVGRWRRALADGFQSPDATPVVNDGEIPASIEPPSRALATFTSKAGVREDHPLNMVSLRAARAFCTFLGGDLPSEAQWEYLATVAGRSRKSLYPWGDRAPSCDEASYARTGGSDEPWSSCWRLGKAVGPGSVGGTEATDRVDSLGVFGLAGGVSEWTRDVAQPLDAPCWKRAPRSNPVCDDPSIARFSARGGAWTDTTIAPMSTRYAEGDGPDPRFGFRCVRGFP